MWVFAVFYFIQGVCEPTEGLISQPVRSMLERWGYQAGEIGRFSFLMALPWSIKPVYGLLTDFVPLAGYRRKSYLLIASAAGAVALFTLWLMPLDASSAGLLLVLLLLPTVGVAFSDVVIDALMVERGQPLGLTGRLQSVQWGSIYAASILTGIAGGYLSQHGLEPWGFLVCGCGAALMLLLTWLWIREPKQTRTNDSIRQAVASLRGARWGPVLAAAGFLFLWNFNPFADAVLDFHLTRRMGFSELFYGEMKSWHSIAAMLGGFAYGFYCRRVSTPTLIHLSILMGILSTLAYWGLQDTTSARLISVVAGAAYITGLMVQLDLAARACPPQAAGTVFALLMALSNLGTSLSTWVGGRLYDEFSATWSNRVAFDLLVAVGALCTACCWLLVPILLRTSRQSTVA